MFQVERFKEVRSFDTFADAVGFVADEKAAGRHWGYIGTALRMVLNGMSQSTSGQW